MLRPRILENKFCGSLNLHKKVNDITHVCDNFPKTFQSASFFEPQQKIMQLNKVKSGDVCVHTVPAKILFVSIVSAVNKENRKYFRFKCDEKTNDSLLLLTISKI
jgi:hypothetical protein